MAPPIPSLRSPFGRPALALAGLAVGAVLRSGCSAPAGSDEGTSIVATTNVYGAIAEAVAGELASVTSIIDSAAQDPHSYEPTVPDQLLLSKADIVIENGGGYDPFVDTMLGAVDSEGITVISASEVSGLLEGEHGEHGSAEDHDAEHEEQADSESTEEHSHEGDDHGHIEGFNEHVWYSFAAMDNLAHELAHELGALDAANAEQYERNYEEFAAGLDELTAQAETLRATHDGQAVAATEAVPHYLFETIGLVDLTPADFTAAVENGTDVAPAVLLETLDVIDGGEVALLAYNEQTAGAETQQLLKAAEQAGVPVVSFTETLPADAGYLAWMRANLESLSAALP